MTRSLILILLMMVSPWLAPCQSTLSSKNKKAIALFQEADNFRVRGQYMEALDLLGQAIDKDKRFAEAYFRRGLVYRSMKKFDLASADFAKSLELTEDQRNVRVAYYELGATQLLSGNYTGAEASLQKYLQMEVSNKPRIEQAKVMLANAQFARANEAVNFKYKLKPLSDTVNRYVYQYFPVLTADQQQLIYTERRGYRDEFDEDLVVSRKDEHGRWTLATSLSKNINSSLNEGTCTVSADGRHLIYTGCDEGKGYGSCDLFESRKVGDEWTVPVNLGPNVNTGDWESQPALSADGRTLYFVSDRRGGFGQRDIWVSKLDENDQWTKAVNMGKPVNTAYDEMSPFIHVNSRTFYFASRGLPGFGGYDIFYVERDSANQWSRPKNIGAPINNHEDQFSLFITADGKKAYYSHEEPAEQPGRVVSRIFEAEIPEDQRIQRTSNYVHGKVVDKETQKPLPAKVELYNIATNEIESLVGSDSVTGEYLIILTQGSEYALYVNKRGYLFKSLNFDYMEGLNTQPIEVDIQLERVKTGSIAVLKNIFFDIDKYDLKDKSMLELQRVVRFLQANPELRIEISGHTDNTGSAAHNRDLSLNRAQSVYNYLTSQGISGRRMITKGYGPDQPIAGNETEGGRQANRRIQFRIL